MWLIRDSHYLYLVKSNIVCFLGPFEIHIASQMAKLLGNLLPCVSLKGTESNTIGTAMACPARGCVSRVYNEVGGANHSFANSHACNGAKMHQQLLSIRGWKTIPESDLRAQKVVGVAS